MMEKKEKYALAVKTIKTAILQGQYAASKGSNRIQLATYFAIGKYISQNSRQGFWGKGAIESISEQLRRELPGLRGFSATNIISKSMDHFPDLLFFNRELNAMVVVDLKKGEFKPSYLGQLGCIPANP